MMTNQLIKTPKQIAIEKGKKIVVGIIVGTYFLSLSPLVFNYREDNRYASKMSRLWNSQQPNIIATDLEKTIGAGKD